MDQIEAPPGTADLRNEVKTLRRARWITRRAAAVALVALVVSGAVAPRGQDASEQQSRQPLAQALSCASRFKVVNDTVELVQLGGDKDGGLAVVNGADGKKRFFAAVENGGGFSDWYDRGRNAPGDHLR